MPQIFVMENIEMKTNRELFEQVQTKFKGRHNATEIVSKYYHSKYPLGCAVGALLTKEERRSLQYKCLNTRLPYRIGKILEDTQYNDVPEVESLREYSVEALVQLQDMHDESRTIGNFKSQLDDALATGCIKNSSGMFTFYLDEEPTNDDI